MPRLLLLLFAPAVAFGGQAPVTLRGQAATPSGPRVVTLNLRCSPDPNGTVSLELIVPGALRPAGFDFNPFEGPDAPAARERLTRLRVEGKTTSAEVTTRVAGWYGGETPGAFVFAASRSSQAPGDLGPFVDALARAGPRAKVTWTQSAYGKAGGEITASFALDAPGQRQIGALAAGCLKAARRGTRVEVSLPAGRVARPLDGRLLLFVSTRPVDDAVEPRFQVHERDATQQVFGIDVDGWAPGSTRVLGEEANGYPVLRLSGVPPGEYTVQALLHVYETFRRADGHVVQLPADRGEGQSLARAPGNLYSRPLRVRLGEDGTARIALDQVIAPLPRPADTRYVKHLEIPNERLSRFWGRPVSLGAVVVLPEGWHDHPEQRYPLAIFHGHFQPTYEEMREQPPDPKLPPVDMEGLRVHCPNGHEGAECTRHGYERLVQERAHAFFETWTSPGFPRAIVLLVQHANPYYDDSYAVNSENLGPYGDAITLDLVPEVERRFRGLGPWARALYGGSTGGWESLAAQVLYPDAYNGAWAACPDPIDFRHYMTIDLYADDNAFRSSGPWQVHAAPRLPRLPGTGPQHGGAGVDARTGAGHALPLRRPVGRLGGGLLAGGSGRLSAPDLRQEHRGHRPRGRPELEGPVRSRSRPAARLGHARPEAEGEDPRRGGALRQLLPERCGLPGRGVPLDGLAARRRGVRLRRARRALLQRRHERRSTPSRGSATPNGSCPAWSNGGSGPRLRGPTRRAGGARRRGSRHISPGRRCRIEFA